MSRPEAQGESCGSGAPADDGEATTDGNGVAARYCAVCGRPAEPAIRRGREVFCSDPHADEFAREVTAVRAERQDR